MAIQFVALPERGRAFTGERRVRLSDCGPDGALRPDGMARYLQDVASDDADDSGVNLDLTWVVRRTALRVAEGGRWPTLGERVALTTWCGGTGAAWAERRTNLAVDGQVLVEAAAMWVPVDRSGQPQRLRPEFFDVYGEATAGRRVSGRVRLVSPPPDALTRPWPLRKADLDVVDHVNNAALWVALSEVVDGPVESATLIHHGPVEHDETLTLATSLGSMWLLVGDAVRVSGEFSRRD